MRACIVMLGWICLWVPTLAPTLANAEEGVFGTVTVQGSAAFAKRMTVVPMTVCQDAPCPKPEPYWTLIINSGRRRYELDAAFAKGSTTPPPSIELAGTKILPGQHVLLEGRVEAISADYALVTEVIHARILPEKGGFQRPARAVVWRCRSLDESGPAHVVEVINSRPDYVTDGEVDLRIVFAAGSGSPREILHGRASAARESGDLIVYRGSNETSDVELVVDQAVRAYSGVPGTLRYWQVSPGEPAAPPAEVQEELSCENGTLLP